MKIVIIGGVAGGASAAARLRRLDEHAEILMLERGKHISFANCGIPYFCGDIIKEEEKLLLMTPEKFKALLNVEARIESEVLKIDSKKKLVVVKNLKTQEEYQEKYDKLILSPGAMPAVPAIKGIEQEKIFTVRTVEDGKKIKAFAKQGMKVAVVGGGFIGIEMAENMVHLGLLVSLIEMAEQVMGVIDSEMAAQIHNHLRSNGVELCLSDAVKEFSETANGKVQLSLKSGLIKEVDFVLFVIGVKPEIKLAKDAGLKLGVTGAIWVDKNLKTSEKDIFALGDAIEVNDIVSESQVIIPLAGPANKQGRVVAENICGRKSVYRGSMGTSIAKVFDLTVASCGNNEKQLKNKGQNYQKIYSLDWSHANYYQTPFQMSLKLLYEKDSGRILGAQIIGKEGVDKRIDIIATVIAMNGTTADLARLELAYAPPFNSAKDPVNVMGMIAENERLGKLPLVFWDEINVEDKNLFLLDVRTVVECNVFSVKNAINIPYEEVRLRLKELPRDKKILVICNQTKKAYFTVQILQQNGFSEVYAVGGGAFVYKNIVKDQEDRKSDFTKRVSDKSKEIIKGENQGIVLEIDACGLQCPGPIMKLSEAFKKISLGETVAIRTTDPGFKSDIDSWCKSTQNKLIEVKSEKGIINALVMKGDSVHIGTTKDEKKHDGKTIVVFSNDLDKALASFVIANGAAATGKKVTMFFTFWGLSILRKQTLENIKKGFLDKMFAWMLPKSAKTLSLSKMHMLGLGTKMMKHVMKEKNVSSLEQLMKQAKQQGVRMIACQMSLDVMGLTTEELIDGVELGGVASYIESAEKSDINLFI